MKRRDLLGLIGGGASVAALAASARADGNSALNLSGQFVDARAFGAVGDGVADDFASLQDAIDACARTGRTLYLRAGRYKISKGLSIRYPKGGDWLPGFRILGDAPGLSLEKTGLVGSVLCPSDAVKGAVLTVSGNPSSDNSNKGQVNGFVVENIGVNGGGRDVDGIVLSYVTNITIRNVHVGFCRNGLVFSRQANGRDFGYGHAITVDRYFAVANGGWGMLSVGEGAISCVLIDPNFTENKRGGIKASGCPLVVLGGGFFGNYGPAVFHGRASEKTDSFGPVFYGTRFESNGREALGCNVILDTPISATFDACYFLCSTLGEHGLFVSSKSDRNASLSLRGVRFSGGSIATQYAVICDKRTLPFDLPTCSFSGYSKPLLVSGQSIGDVGMLSKAGSMQRDAVSDSAIDGLRLGRYLISASDRGLSTSRLW